MTKTNLCRYPEALGVRFEDNGSAAPEICYADAPKAYKEPTQAEACAAWLLEVLEEAGEPMRPRDVLELGAEAGFTQGVIYRARKELEGAVVNNEGKRAPNNRWALVEG